MKKRGRALRRRYGKRKLTGNIERLYSVTSYDAGEPEIMQAASLVPGAAPHVVEHVLSTTSGVYAPRGLDLLKWSRDKNSAKIIDAEGHTIVTLKLSRSSR